MLKVEVETIIDILKRYYILMELPPFFTFSLNIYSGEVHIFNNFSTDFDSQLDKKSYDITRTSDGYIIKNPISLLYFVHTYRNFLQTKSIDCLEYMKNDFYKSMIKEFDLKMSSQTWMSLDDKNNSRYFETKKSVKLQSLLDEFDKMVNPLENNEEEFGNVVELNPYIDRNRKCVKLKIQNEKVVTKFLRRYEGFVYTYINTDENFQICHYFNNEFGECISAEINETKLRYQLENGVLTIDDKKIVLTDESLIYFLLESINHFDKELYNKILSLE